MCIFVFYEFFEDVRFLENRNNIFKESSLKAFFSNLSSDSRYLESVTLKVVSCYIMLFCYGTTEHKIDK